MSAPQVGKPILGVVFQPITNRLYYAVKDEGAFLVDDGKEPKKLQVSEKFDFREMTLAVSRSHRRHGTAAARRDAGGRETGGRRHDHAVAA